MFTFIAIGTLIITTLINAYGVRLLSILNNIGVATEILGMFVFAIILLIFANVQPVSVLTSFEGSEAAQNGNIPATFALGFFMAAFVVFGFDTAGTFGEETLDAGAPGAARRAVVDPHLRPRRRDLHPGGHPGHARHPRLDGRRASPAASRSGRRSRTPSARTSSATCPAATSTCS